MARDEIWIYCRSKHVIYMLKEKYTKKATAKIYNELVKLDKNTPKLTTLDQAFVILMDKWELELDVIMEKRNTTCGLYRNEEKIHTWDFEDKVWIDKIGDFDWDIIYKTVLEDIIKLKLYKAPKKLRAKKSRV